jgi:hypothetical protein
MITVLVDPGIKLGDGTRLGFRKRLDIVWENAQLHYKELRDFGLMLLFCLFVFATLAIGSTAVSAVQLDNMALSTSPTCGVWINRNLTRSMLYVWAKAEEQSAAYYRNCYEASSSAKVCNIFSNNGRLSTSTDNDTCPFRADMCLLGPSSAITLDTGILPSNTLGINSGNTVYYQRKTTCAPVTTEGYVITQDNYNGIIIGSRFYYGGRVSNWTYEESRIFKISRTTVPSYQIAIRKAG